MARTKHSQRSLSGSKVPRGVIHSKAPSKVVRGIKKMPKREEPVKARVMQTTLSRAKYRPGSLALREVRQYQKTTSMLLRRAPFQRLCRSLLDDLASANASVLADEQGTTRMTRDSLLCLQEASEAYLIRMIEAAQLLAVHAKRKTLFRRDFLLLQRLCQRDVERIPFPVRGISSDGATAFLQRRSWRTRQRA